MAERSIDRIRQARRDIEMAENAMVSGFYEWACFASQQAAEKAVKAVFQKLGALAWGHSVYDLLRVLAKKMNVPEDLLNCGRLLDRYLYPHQIPKWI